MPVETSMEGGGGGGTATAAMRTQTELQISKKWRHSREASPERTKVWTEPSNSKSSPRTVPVVYYLSRNGHLEHPHFMEVPLSSSDGLYLKDVIHRLNLLRGTGMAAMYSWSSKRAYKNGFVWQDLTQNDFVYPSHGSEYVLKGSELLHDAVAAPSSSSSSTRPLESVSFRSPKLTEEQSEDGRFPVSIRRRNQSWSSIDLQEYKVYKTESNSNSTGKPAADAATQTDDKRRRSRRQAREKEAQSTCEDQNIQNETTELSREEISPPPSDSSPETLETLMKADKRLALSGSGELDNPTAVNLPSGGRMRVLMQLISCGSFSFKDCGATYLKDHEGLSSLIGHYKGTLPRGSPPNENSSGQSGHVSSLAGLKLDDKEYFSGSLIETKKDEIPTLKRSSSYNADGSSSQRQLKEKDIDEDEDQRARPTCIPIRFKPQSTNAVTTTVRTETAQTLTTATCSNGAVVSNGQLS